MAMSGDWTILEKLILTQAVYKYGENMWFQVARILKQHGLIQPHQRQQDFFSQKVKNKAKKKATTLPVTQ